MSLEYGLTKDFVSKLFHPGEVFEDHSRCIRYSGGRSIPLTVDMIFTTFEL
jgi:hypothetical protein